MTEPEEPPPPPMLAPMPPSIPARPEPISPPPPAAEAPRPTESRVAEEEAPAEPPAVVEAASAAEVAPVEQPVAAPAPLEEPIDEAPTAAAPEQGRPPRAAVFSLLALAVVVSILLALVTVRLSDRQGSDAGQSDVTATASSAVATVLSYDYRHLAKDFATAEKLLTPTFRKQYDATTAKGVQPLASKYKAVSTASVSAAGIVSLAGPRAVVLVFVQQTVTNTQLSAPRLDRSRINVSLVKSNGHWLIDKLTPL